MAEPTPDNVAIIVLAAGSSSRLGEPKQLLKIGNDSLLRRTILTALALKANSTIVVLGHRASEFKKEIADLPVTVLENKDWLNGMGSSIKYGISFVKSDISLKAVIVMTCDQPLLSTNHLRNLAEQYSRTKSLIVASRYSGLLGIPALFDRSLFNTLLQIGNQEGAKKVIRENEANAVAIDFAGGEIDLDTKEDYQNFLDRKF